MIFASSLFWYLPGSDRNIMLRSSIKCLNLVRSPLNILGGFNLGAVDRSLVSGITYGIGTGTGAGAGTALVCARLMPYQILFFLFFFYSRNPVCSWRL